MYLSAYTQKLKSIGLWIVKIISAVLSSLLQFCTIVGLLVSEEIPIKSNGAVAVLVELPHDLFCSIVEEWIVQPLFITFVVLDTAAQENKSLKATLASHFAFMRSSGRKLSVSYDSSRGYYSDDKMFDLKRHCTRLTKQLTFDVYGLMTHKEINCVAFANCCSNLQVLYWYGDNLTQVSASALKSLTHLRVDCEDHELSVIVKNCHKLEKLVLRDLSAFTHRRNFCTLVKVNPNLKHLDTSGSIDLLDTIYYFCPNIESIILRISDETVPYLKRVGRVFERSDSKLKHCKINYFSYEVFEVLKCESSIVIGNYREQHSDYEINKFISVMKDISRWDFRDFIVDVTVNHLAEACTSNITYFSSSFSSQLTLSSLSFMFKRCTGLRECFLFYLNLSCADIVKLFGCVPASLRSIQLHTCEGSLTVSGVISILQTCQHLESCAFYRVIDDALTDPSVVPLLIDTLLTYPTQLRYCKIKCTILTDAYIVLYGSTVFGHNVPHYGLPVDVN